MGRANCVETAVEVLNDVIGMPAALDADLGVAEVRLSECAENDVRVGDDLRHGIEVVEFIGGVGVEDAVGASGITPGVAQAASGREATVRSVRLGPFPGCSR